MQQRTAYLLERYIAGSINDIELTELHQLAEHSGPDLQQGIQQWLQSQDADPAYNPAQWQQVLGNIMGADKQEGMPAPKLIPFYKRPLFRYAAAAAAIIIVGFSLWFAGSGRTATPTETQTVAQKNVPPGKDGAILTLADGTKLVLDSMGNGLVATQKGTHVVLNDGQISYYSDAKGGSELLYNTMTTPRGRQFNVTLPDGTRVWLNAASSLRYPVVFNGTERKVEITGEAYFEVAQNKEKPFKVNIDNRMEVEVLGTHFNVNAYADEPSIKTTLLEGSVKVNSPKANPENNGASVILKPGQQAQQMLPGNATDLLPSMRVRQADLDEVVAWKEGAFAFNDADLPAVMRQLSRWYNMDVEYAGAVPKGLFSGKMGRDLSLADVLAQLVDYDVKFRIEGDHRIVVLP